MGSITYGSEAEICTELLEILKGTERLRPQDTNTLISNEAYCVIKHAFTYSPS